MRHRPRPAAAVAAIIAGLAAAGVRSQAPQSRLTAPVTLTGAPTTLAAFASEIKSQAGLEIRFPAYLADRRVQVGSSGQSADRLIGALCELEGWRWRPGGDGAYVRVDPPAPRLEANETYYAAIRRLTPPDLATYLKMPPPNKSSGLDNLGALEGRRRDVMKRLLEALTPHRARLAAGGVHLCDLKPDDRELVVLASMFAPRSLQGLGELMANSDWLLARPQATRLSLEHETILLIDCDLGPRSGVCSFGANTAPDH